MNDDPAVARQFLWRPPKNFAGIPQVQKEFERPKTCIAKINYTNFSHNLNKSTEISTLNWSKVRNIRKNGVFFLICCKLMQNVRQKKIKGHKRNRGAFFSPPPPGNGLTTQ